ncbi:hypothetical protein GPECTOR_51g712 [Gonium pectorale]|uniref:Fe2OG dioxygenase domain-containing protein n=1 Tax=Gonium pectorale TaxID=33097 RepID=A0A150G782_GONPE|nr:hypothetical protein GPECTOR_51g712 [Gonium pectorale]|eukprot:KXZ45726.1 hypothetical protein GPECTOR_51g712 [Gonium pectorale]
MASQRKDAKWLKEQLARVLGWDELIVEGLVDTVVRAAGPGGDRSEVDEMVENFMADSPAGIALINDFLSPSAAARAAPASTSSAAGGAAAGGRSYAASAGTAAAPQSPAAAAPAPYRPLQHQQQQQQQRGQQQPQSYGGGSGGGGGGGGGSSRQGQAASASAATASAGWQAFGRGTAAAAVASPAKPTGAAGGGNGRGADDGDDFARFVVDERAAGGKGGGGSRSKQGSSRDLQATAAGGGGGGAEGGKVLGMFKAGGRIKAPAAKPVGVRGPDLAASLERQVVNCLGCGKIYDCRNVTNDILRFLDRGGVCTFCGDTVALTYKDRQKAAAAAAAAAAEQGAAAAADGASRDQDGAGAGAAAAAGSAPAEDAATAAARAFKDRLVEYDRNAAKRTTVIDDQSDYFEIDTNAWLTDQEREELRRRQRMEAEAEAARRKRLTVTIDLIGRKVVLDEDVRKEKEAAEAAAAERAAAAAKAAAAAEALRNTDGDGGGSVYGSGAAFKGNSLHDLGAEYGFDAFGAEVALEELLGGAGVLAAEAEAEAQDAPYDICPPDLAPSTSYTPPVAAPRRAPPRAAPGLPHGVVLLKGYLTLDEQIQIVRQIRDLGVGPGGFYVPTYSTGGRLALRMMCLGLHWEPRTGAYEQTRSSYDGATPPPLPATLVDLCGRSLADASAAAASAGGSRFPPLRPDICLANFYERSGRLGMHQDKDEMPDSLRAGLPVVSLSIGDSADFLYGKTRDPEQASSVRLDSGDLLVFGGPGRMIFHSVSRIHRDSAPRELLAATGMRPGRLNLTFRQYRAAPASS